MKRILHVVGSMNAGGMETMIMNYYRHIDRTKFQFDFLIFTPGQAFYEDEIISLGGKIYKITARRKNYIKNYLELKKFFKNHKPDIVEIHQGVTTLLPLKLSYRYGIKRRIVHNHGIDLKMKKLLGPYIELYVKKMISLMATDFFACSENVLSDLYEDDILEDKKYFICPNAIETTKFKFSKSARDSLKTKFNCDDKIVFGHVGRFTYPKNHEFLINVFEKIHNENPNTVLWLIGDGTLENSVKDIVISKGLQDSIIFMGQRSDVPNYMSAIDILLFPSLFEGFPLTLIEAQINGLPIIASNRITDLVNLTGDIKFLPLDEKIWLDYIMKFIKQKKFSHKKYDNKLFSEYDIEVATKKLMNKYEEG